MSYTNGSFEVELPANALTGTIGANAYEPGEAPTTIFDINDLVNIDCNWSLTGWMERMVCGTWECDAYFESIGEGEEFELEGCTMPLDPGGGGKYSCTLQVPPGRIKPAAGETDIMYKVVVSVTYKDPKGRPGPLAGYVELPMVQFYKDA